MATPKTADYTTTEERSLDNWQQWLQHPERMRVRKFVFQVHFWVGAIAAPYVLVMSLSGAAIVFRNEVSRTFSLEWLVRFHSELMLDEIGRIVNGIGGLCVTLLCLTGAVIWWPGMNHWRRSLTVSWRAHFPRISWDLQSALGFWCLPFVLLWAISGIYLSLPQSFNILFLIDRRDRVADFALFWLSQLHFGRFGVFAEIVWSLLGLVPAILAFTGVFVCCRRVFYNKSSNPNTASE
jgi:uncharacterized iron-regulated membrane protein